eukprot:Protomagalhaensia_sp_Gyna_25__2774@NODE_25_length_7429_cov_37_925304_g6_i3_p1_GENE_NODE_25_length_7429_cov_37_925304_g6_i3NODE_25_length_7429_cov_37_925304_g6_i3_p1_ORF_typecomplete_len519_score85_88TPR_15/PF13429_6/2_6e05TPR_15/PF13429_6/0_00017TPR_15/PF13429_6/5_8e11TPR_15/PF13429_6/0_012TPR_19/PF14559_6/0_041TPR_19/PF14559_6/0_00042TPR_19/PF14559_6/0_042TPR_19/PF14559_6/0_0057TPR_19/PF14559_6/4_6e05TPR_19/PF14559_6/0_026TPR_16/PF13432_6/0_008TPR_16/PF13432_6/0_024TPR_16/PF13432_6/0_0021TPR_16
MEAISISGSVHSPYTVSRGVEYIEIPALRSGLNRGITTAVCTEIPSFPESEAAILARQGDVGLEKGHLDKALSCFRKAQEANPENLSYGAKAAAILLHRDQFDEFNEAWVRLKRERNEVLVARKIEIETPRGRNEIAYQTEAILYGYLPRMGTIGLSEIIHDCLLSVNLLEQNRIEAFDDLTKKLERVKRFSVARQHRESGDDFYKFARFRGAAEEFSKALLLRPRNLVVWRKLAWCHYWMSDFEAALRDSKRGLGRSPRDYEGLWLRGLCHIQLGETSKGKLYCNKALQKKAHHKAPKESFPVFYSDTDTDLSEEDGETETEMNDAADNRTVTRYAVKANNESIRANPFNPEAWANRARRFIDLDDRESAMKDYTTYLLLKPDDDEIWNLCGSWYWQLRQHSRAMECCKAAIKAKPDASRHWFLQAAITHDSGNLKLALRDIDHCIYLDSTHDAWTLKAKIHEDLGDYRQAQHALQRALQMGEVSAEDKEEHTKDLQRLTKKLEF